MFFTILSFVAATLTTVSFLPQAIMTVRTKDTSGISLTMYVLFVLGVLLWIVYGLYKNDPALYLANIITGVFAIIILTCKIQNVRNGKG